MELRKEKRKLWQVNSLRRLRQQESLDLLLKLTSSTSSNTCSLISFHGDTARGTEVMWYCHSISPTQCHSNTPFPLINKPTRNANNNSCILDHTWTNQLYDTFNGIFLLDITDHYPIFTIAPINCLQKRIRVKFWDHSGQNLAKLRFKVEHYLNTHVQINQDVSANTNNFCNNLFVIYSKCCLIKEKEISFTRHRKPWISDATMVSLNRKHQLFRQYKNGIVTFDHYNSFKNNFTTRNARNRTNQLYDTFNGIFLLDITDHYVMQEIIISRENSQSARIIQGTHGNL